MSSFTHSITREPQMRHLLVMIGIFAIVGCAERPGSRAEDAGTRSGADNAPSKGMMNMPSMGMMPAMRAHMDSMRTASPDRMKTMMADHQEMASRMMDAMGSDMRMMSMAGDSGWAALSDSVRRDLADLPDLAGQRLATRMKAHLERMQRLMAQHETMMGAMK
jgi:hypothetical protein